MCCAAHSCTYCKAPLGWHHETWTRDCAATLVLQADLKSKLEEAEADNKALQDKCTSAEVCRHAWPQCPSWVSAAVSDV